MTDRAGAHAAFTTWTEEVARRGLPVVLLRPRPTDLATSFEGDFDYVFDPDAMADVVAVALHAATVHAASIEIEQTAPFKRRIRFWSEDGASILLELWPHVELVADGAPGAIGWSQLRPHRTAAHGLPQPILGLIYMTHLHAKGKDLGSAQVRSRLDALVEDLAGSSEPAAPEALALVDGLRSGSVDAATASRAALDVLERLGIRAGPNPRVTLVRTRNALERRLRALLVGDRHVPAVPILGPDGSGKSALIGALPAAFGAEGHAERLVFKRVFRRSFVVRGFVRRSLARGGRSGELVPRNIIEERHPGLVLGVATLRWPWARGAARRRARAMAGPARPVVVVDRFFWDYLVAVRDPRRAPAPIPGRERWSRRIPRPEAVIVLACAPEVLHERKQELAAAAIELVYRNYGEQIAQRRVRRALLLSTEQPIEVSAAEAARFLSDLR